VKGFKLLNDFNEIITVLIEFTNITALWILHLSKVINESGFHSFYKPIRVLGKGSSATVYEIARLDDGKRFAAKVFSKDGIKNSRNKMNCFMN
jgi:serine/threonine protein kinase